MVQQWIDIVESSPSSKQEEFEAMVEIIEVQQEDKLFGMD